MAKSTVSELHLLKFFDRYRERMPNFLSRKEVPFLNQFIFSVNKRGSSV